MSHTQPFQQSVNTRAAPAVTTLLALAAITCLLSACGAPYAAQAQQPASNPQQIAAPLTSQTPAPISQEPPPLAAPHPFWSPLIGQTVSVKGVYEGWASCEESGQQTRSDWVLRQTHATNPSITGPCVFVSGGVPQGVAPPPSKVSVGMPVFIKAVVQTNPTGRVYLQLVQ